MLPLQPGVLVPLRPERRLPRSPLWPDAVERSTDLFTRARARARGLQQLRSFTLAPAHVWKYLDCTKRAGARVEGGGACLGHAHSVYGRKGRARARLTGSGPRVPPLLPV